MRPIFRFQIGCKGGADVSRILIASIHRGLTRSINVFCYQLCTEVDEFHGITCDDCKEITDIGSDSMQRLAHQLNWGLDAGRAPRLARCWIDFVLISERKK